VPFAVVASGGQSGNFWLHPRTYNIMGGRDNSEDFGVDGRIILEWMLGKLGGKVWTGCMWLKIVTSSGLL
jgi:hypothetical protein